MEEKQLWKLDSLGSKLSFQSFLRLPLTVKSIDQLELVGSYQVVRRLES
jgi:hypothetical protein